MEMNTKNNWKKGKAIEHYIIYELLKNDFDVFVPVVDTGIDLIIKDREGGFVEIQVKSRDIQNDEDVFFIKDFEPNFNFFIVCHNMNTGDFFCMPSKKFHQKSNLDEEKNQRTMPYSKIKMHSYAENENGIALLKKALESKQNRVSGYLDREPTTKQDEIVDKIIFTELMNHNTFYALRTSAQLNYIEEKHPELKHRKNLILKRFKEIWKERIHNA